MNGAGDKFLLWRKLHLGHVRLRIGRVVIDGMTIEQKHFVDEFYILIVVRTRNSKRDIIPAF